MEANICGLTLDLKLSVDEVRLIKEKGDSGIFIPTSLLKDSRLNTNDKLVLSQLIYLSKNKGYAYPSQSYLKEHCGISLRTVQRSIKTLVGLSLISVKHEYVKGKKEIERTIYIVNLAETEKG